MSEKPSSKVFAFWHSRDAIPGYIQLCLDTWRMHIHDHEIVILDFSNVGDYLYPEDAEMVDAMRKRLDKIKYAAISDFIRCGLLYRNGGGVWLDTDTVVVSDEFEREFMGAGSLSGPVENVMYGSTGRYADVAFGYVAASGGSKFIAHVREQQRKRVEGLITGQPWRFRWDILANSIVTPYLRAHPSEFKVLPAERIWAECGGHPALGGGDRGQRYGALYFTGRGTGVIDVHHGDFNMLSLHNSWTPGWYRNLTKEQALASAVPLSQVLREVLHAE